MQVTYKVFVASTDAAGMRDECDRVFRAIIDMGHVPVSGAAFQTGGDGDRGALLRTMEGCDYLLVVVGGTGAVPLSSVETVEAEYDHALSLGLTVAGLVAPEFAVEGDPLLQTDRRQSLVSYLRADSPIDVWNDLDDLYHKAWVALKSLIALNPRTGLVPAAEAAGPEVAVELARLSSENQRLRRQLEAVRLSAEEATQEYDSVLLTLRSNRILVPLWRRGADDWDDPIEVSMFQFFYQLGPELLAAKPSAEVAEFIPTGVCGLDAKDIRTHWPVPANMVHIWMADLMSLGLVRPVQRKQMVQGSRGSWTLTKKGRRVLARARRPILEQAQVVS